MRTQNNPRHCALYRFFDDRNSLLYVGVSLTVLHRFASHGNAPWFQAVRRIEIEWHADRALALAAERAAIVNEKPRYNRAHNGGGMWEAVERQEQIAKALRPTAAWRRLYSDDEMKDILS